MPWHRTVSYTHLGADLFITDDEITVERKGDLRPVDIQTLPFPGFPTDLQAQFMVLCALANGNSCLLYTSRCV